MSEKQIDFRSLVSFARTNGLKIILRAGLSLCAVVALLALYAMFAPRSERFAIELQVTLESQNGAICYPNGDEVSYVILLYICRDWTGEPRPQPGEVEELRFFAPDQIPENISPVSRRPLNQFLNAGKER